MSLLERVKSAFRTQETIAWECNDCDTVFTTTVPESDAPAGVRCEECGSTDVVEISRSYG
ncbi:hypothetical protein [Halomarina litorea]|uniref:hypothetical protein n=1 Tax=Halomarina litorea TaxID=2961595 RepID=UPI0020C2204A|nr:hypothetical protein [Halomarina sp. BCD28]